MIQFGIPKRVINKKEEMFPDTPVVTMLAWEGKGYNKKFGFNQSAIELLELIPGINSVNFAFDDETFTAYIGKDNGEGAKSVAKNSSMSDKKLYDYIAKHYELDERQDNYMELTGGTDLGTTVVYKLSNITPINMRIIPSNPIVDKEIEHLTQSGFKPEFSEFEEGEEELTYQPHGHSWQG